MKKEKINKDIIDLYKKLGIKDSKKTPTNNFLFTKIKNKTLNNRFAINNFNNKTMP